MIDFTQETYLSLRQEMLDRVPDTYDKRDTAPIPTAISPAAYTLAGFYLSLDQVQRAAFVQTAVGDSLDMLPRPSRSLHQLHPRVGVAQLSGARREDWPWFPGV